MKVSRFSTIISLIIATAHGLDSEHDERVRRRIDMISNEYPPNWPYLGHCINPHGPGGLLNFTLRPCEESEIPPFNSNSRVAIVGAGPAGIYMAKLLHDRGFTSLTLFEKENRVGGKAKSIELENGEKIDVGTIWTANKYECVEHLADAVNMTEKPVDPDGETPRLVSSDDAILFDMKPPFFGPFAAWSADYAFQKYYVNPNDFAATFAQNAQDYIALWTQTMGSVEYMFPNESTVDFDALNRSFLSWLEERELYALIPFLILSTSGQGYGNLETLPAFYGLTTNHPNYFGGTGSQSGMSEDWQTMYERILATTDATVKLETEVLKIKRNFQGTKVLIEYRDRTDRTLLFNRKVKESFDFLIMAAPMPFALNMLQEPTEEESKLFAEYNYRSVRYDVGYLDSTGSVPDSFNLFSWMDRHDKQTDYHTARRDGEREVFARDGIDGALTLVRQGRIKDRGSNSTIIGSISPFGTSKEEVQTLLAQDLSEYGMTMTFVHTEIWPDYMPWKNLTQVVEEGQPWRIWDNQGSELTWYIGSYVSFENVAEILDYNIKMVNEKLCV